MKKVLELSYLKNNHYPEPDNVVNITYSWSLAWYMWEFWEEVRRKVERINPVPRDPITETNYAYGLTNNRQEYELWAMLENSNNVSMNIISKANANSEWYTAYISWNYNKKILSIRTGSRIMILWVPTLITTDVSITELKTITEEERRSLFSINNKTNLPGNIIEKINTWILWEWFIVTREEIYENWTIQNTDVNGWETSLLLYEWDISDLSNETTKEKVWENIISYYRWTESTIWNLYQEMTWVNWITLVDTLINNRQWWLNSKDISLSNNTSWSSSGWWSTPTNSCSTQPNYTNANFITWEPTNENQAWQNTNSTNPCYYQCINWYTWGDCSTPPITCPTWYVLVPWNPTFSTTDFCVAKYEMKNVWWVATSQSALNPWVSITQSNAITACNNLWPWYHLITNNEWMTIARNIEANSQNWANWVVWSLVSEGWWLYRWNVNLNDSATCGNSIVLDWDTPWINCLVGDRNKRIHILSNGNEIWDLSWNVWEHVNGTNNIFSTTWLVIDWNVCWSTAWNSWSSINDGLNSCNFTNTSPTFYSKSNYWPLWDYNALNGVWRIYSSISTNRLFARGGSYYNTAPYVGVFTLTMYGGAIYDFLGFRCVFNIN